MTAIDPVLDAIAHAATAAASGSHAWVVVRDKDELRIAAAAGDGSGALLGMPVSNEDGPAGYVVRTAQPAALARRDDAGASDGIASRLGTSFGPTLCVPCSDSDDVFGALEVVGNAGRPMFSFDDVELVTLLGTIAGAAIGDGGPRQDVPAATELAAELERAELEDPRRYAALATTISALLGSG